MLEVCRSELQLAAAFFRTAHHPTAQADLIEGACTVLADVLRPQYIQLRALDDLVDLVAVLREAVEADALAHRSSRAARTAEAAVFRIMHDVQERLIFRASVRFRLQFADPPMGRVPRIIVHACGRAADGAHGCRDC